MKPQSKPQLPNSVSSLQDVNDLIAEIHEYSKWYSHNAIKKRVHARRGLASPPEISQSAKEMLSSWETQNPLSVASLDNLISALERYKTTAPSMVITLAAPAPNDLKQTLVAWCRKNISPDVMVTFRFNSTLLGGMVVRWGSHVFDWSFRRYILAEKAKFPEALRRV